MKTSLILAVLLLIKIGADMTHNTPAYEVKQKEALQAPMKVKATYYYPVRGQCNTEPHITANGTKIDTLNPPRIIAISRDLDSLMGRIVTVIEPEIIAGEWVVADRMNKRWKERMDFMLAPGVRVKVDSVVITLR